MNIKSVRFLTKYLGLLGIITAFFVFAKPYLINGLIPYPSSHLVTYMPPWNSYDTFSKSVKNNAMPDIVSQIYPWKVFTIAELKQGRLPLWDPFIFAGTPHLANFQTAVFSPLNLLYFILPFIDAWTISILLQPLLAGIFMYIFLRRMRVSSLGASTGSISFMFCGFMVVWMAYGTLSLAVSFLPLMLYSIESYFQKKTQKYLLLLAAAVAFSVFSGHFQTSLYAVIFAVSFLVFKTFTTNRIRDGAIVLGGITCGFILSSIQLIPTLVFFSSSLRSSGSIVDNGIPYFYLITSIIPDFFGNPVTRNDWMSFYAERASFIGIVPFTLSLFSLNNRHNREILFFFISGAISLLFAISSPLQSLLSLSHLPVISSSNPVRIIVLFSFAFSVLAGYGFDSFFELLEKKKWRRVYSVFIPIAVLIGTAIFLALLFLSRDKSHIALRNSVLSTILLFLFLGIVLASALVKSKKIRLLLPFLILLLIAFDSLRFSQKWMPTDSKLDVYPSVPVLQALNTLKNDGRVFQAIGAETQLIYGISGIEGYDSLFLGRYAEFIEAAKKGEYVTPERNTVRLDREGNRADRVLDILDVTTIFHPVSFNNASYAYPVWKDQKRYPQIYKDDHFELYRNTTAEKRVKLYYSYEVESDTKKLLKRFYQPDFPFKIAVLLESKPSQIPNPRGTGSAQIISDSPEKVIIKTNSSSPALLFLADPYFNQWRVTVNKKQSSVMPADYAFRAVEVPKGESVVVFSLPLINL